MALKDLVFSDICVAESSDGSWYKATPDSLKLQTIPSECMGEAADLYQRLLAHQGNGDFRVFWPDENGLRMRVRRMNVLNDLTVFVCRRYGVVSKSLLDLGMPKGVAERMFVPDLKDGLVVFFGKTGSGKTTAACAYIQEFLIRRGGACWTIENPIEIFMQGRHGDGVCYQTEVERDEDIGPAILDLYRVTPNIIFIGELRTASAVQAAVSLGTSGVLVVATMHSDNLVSGLGRIDQYAGDNNRFADAFRVGMHLALHNAENRQAPAIHGLFNRDGMGTGTPPRVLSVEPLWVTKENQSSMKSILRSTGNLDQLKSEIDRQKRSLMNGGLP